MAMSLERAPISVETARRGVRRLSRVQEREQSSTTRSYTSTSARATTSLIILSNVINIIELVLDICLRLYSDGTKFRLVFSGREHLGTLIQIVPKSLSLPFRCFFPVSRPL